MFGYVLANPKDLNPEDKERYSSYYCGLCSSLEKAYGRKASSFLSYDIVFLDLLLSDLYEPKETLCKGRCFAKPLKKHTFRTSEISAYSADMLSILTYFSALDSIKDGDKSKREKAKDYFESYVPSWDEKYPRQMKAIRENLKRISDGEERGEESIITMSGYFGSLLGEVFAPKEDIWHGRLFTIGSGIGRFIYALDCYDDLKGDEKKGNYNPLIKISKNENFEENFKERLEWHLSDASNAMEALPLKDNLPLIRNILYSGIWTKYEVRRRERSI